MRLWGKALAACVLAAALAACGDAAESVEVPTAPAAATVQPTATIQAVATAEATATPTAAPESASTPAVEAAAADAAPAEAAPTPPTRTQSITLYDLTQLEKTCPGYQEFTGFRQTVSQVKITCTRPGVETVYFVDLDNLVVTGIRVPLLEPEMP